MWNKENRLQDGDKSKQGNEKMKMNGEGERRWEEGKGWVQLMKKDIKGDDERRFKKLEDAWVRVMKR